MSHVAVSSAGEIVLSEEMKAESTWKWSLKDPDSGSSLSDWNIRPTRVARRAKGMTRRVQTKQSTLCASFNPFIL